MTTYTESTPLPFAPLTRHGLTAQRQDMTDTLTGDALTLGSILRAPGAPDTDYLAWIEEHEGRALRARHALWRDLADATGHRIKAARDSGIRWEHAHGATNRHEACLVCR